VITKNGGTKSQQEIIPSADLPQFEQALATMSDIESTLGPVVDEAKAIKVVDKTTYARAGALLAQGKAAVKTSDATMASYELIIKTVKDYILERKNRVKALKEEISDALTPKMVEYDRAEKAAAQAERDREALALKQKLDREAEEKRRKDEENAAELRKQRVAEIREDLKAGKITKRQAEKLLREAGAMEEAAKAQAAADADEATQKASEIAARVKVEPNVPAVRGVVRRVNYYAECIDPDAFLKEFIKEYNLLGHFGKLREFIMIENQILSAKAREVKDSEKMAKMYPAIRAWEQKSF